MNLCGFRPRGVSCPTWVFVDPGNQEAKRPGPAAEVHDQVASPLSGPGAVGMCGHAEDVHVPGGHFRDE